ncbi:Chromosome partition protein Smc [Legionella moravica]|uniref:Chromosome partition protein Smc n=1 Tax=Legionella moravica TaxID=39962 RepID=A0A378JVV2_9GAMM|nr:hypothetical protein [Legionella moravica]KTD35663.1 Chromosome partition protein Smc [Legionella moravica]STX62793.1 Uncharacterised protein [Legionella moravica]
MTFTLTLLGTDTAYTPGRLENAYDKAETLSYISTMIQGSPQAVDECTQFRNSNVAVVNGPTTLGQEVGDRIARGVQAILEAISRGEENISIIAHSRGAVEAILVAHELERIQSLLSDPNYDRRQLSNSECKYTRTAMNGTHRDALSSINLDHVAAHIGKVKLSILNIDPVPGGNYMVVTHASSLAWRDPRFYRVPKIVSEYEQYTYENERTRCFKAIVPKCDSPDTQFKLVSLPGHHGTGSGNLSDQQRKINPDGTTDHVQELVLIKIIEFLKRHDVTLHPGDNPDDPFAELISPLFDGTEYSPEFNNRVQALYYRLYDEIITNRDAYRQFNKTSYPVLGQEQAFIRRIWNVLDQRIVHYQAHNDTYLESVVPVVPGGRFLNYEHARIHLTHELGLRNNAPLNETINQSVQRFVSLCLHTKALKDLKDRPAALANITDSVRLDTLAATIETKEGFALMLDGLKMLIEEVRRPYLQDQLTNPEERASLYFAVQSAFAEFRNLARDPDNEVAQKINEVLNTSLESTLTSKRESLAEDYKNISIKLRENTFFNVLQNKLQEISTNLNQLSDGRNSNEYNLDIKIRRTLIEMQQLKERNPNPQAIREFIDQELISYREFAEQLASAELHSELANNSLQWVNGVMNEALEDSIDYDTENLMAEVISAHHRIEHFRVKLPDFKAFNDELDYTKWNNELEEQRDHLIRLVAEYIVNHKLDLLREIKPLYANNDALYKQIEGLAIGLGAVNHVEMELARRNTTISELQLQLRTLERQNEEQQAGTLALESAKRLLEQQNASLGRENQVLKSNVSSLTSDNAQLEESLTAVRGEKLALEAANSTLINDKARVEESLVVVQGEKSVLDAVISTLTEDKARLEEGLAAVQGEKSALDASISTLTENKARLEEGLAAAQGEKSALETTIARLEIENQQIFARLQQSNRSALNGQRALADENQSLKDVLNNDTELQCQMLVRSKLIPLTQEYLIHLAKEVKQSVNHDLVVTNASIPSLIEDIRRIDVWPENESSSILKKKIDSVSALFEHLNDDRVIKPSDKVIGFYTKLNEANEDIKKHKDPKWQRYIANTAAVIGIVLTGVLPGLAALAIVSAVTGNSPKFWQSKGQTFIEKAKEEMNQNLPTISPTKGS